MAYFFQFALHKRQGFYYGYLATASGLVVYSVGYTVSILLFMVTRLVVMPHEAGGIVGAVAGLAVYAIAMTVGLRHLRHRIVARMMGAESKGQLDAALTKAGLDTRSMMFRTVGRGRGSERLDLPELTARLHGCRMRIGRLAPTSCSFWHAG